MLRSSYSRVFNVYKIPNMLLGRRLSFGNKCQRRRLSKCTGKCNQRNLLDGRSIWRSVSTMSYQK